MAAIFNCCLVEKNNLFAETLYIYIYIYIIFIKHNTLLVETTTVCFILSNRQVVTRKQKYIVICGKNNTLEINSA